MKKIRLVTVSGAIAYLNPPSWRMGGSRYNPMIRIWAKPLLLEELRENFKIARQHRMNIGEKNKPINCHFSLAYRVAVLIYMKEVNAEKSHHQHQESGEGCNQINEKRK